MSDSMTIEQIESNFMQNLRENYVFARDKLKKDEKAAFGYAAMNSTAGKKCLTQLKEEIQEGTI